MSRPQAAYVHVPFCRHRCGYCDFTVIADRSDLMDRYVACLARELATLEQPAPVSSLFVGGGTPTQLPPSLLTDFLQQLQHWLPLRPEAEFTVEANPADVTDELIAILADAGANRISLGVQSFQRRELEVLERDHDQVIIERAVAIARRRIPNVSIDLIFAVPGQTLEDWQRNLSQAVRLQPAHISTYGLTIEKGTSFWSRVRRGELPLIDDSLQREMYQLAMETLEEAGWQQYELSNFARPGFACRHNQVYWMGDEFWGFGPGAARYVAGTRATGHRSVTSWIKRIESGQSPIAEAETLEPEPRARELAMLNLRTIAGIAANDFQRRTGWDPRQLFAAEIRRHQDRGWLESDASGIRLTRAGRFVADTVMADFL